MNETGFFIRDAVPADRPALVGMMQALQDLEVPMHPSRVPGPVMADQHLAYLEALAASTRGRVLVAVDGDEPVGFAICCVESEDAADCHVKAGWREYGLLTDLFVSPRYRRKGIARALVAAVEEHVRRLGLQVLRLHYLQSNREAVDFYQRAGYRPYEVVAEKSLA